MPIFTTPFEQHADREGQRIVVVRTITDADDTHDAEVLPMHVVRFDDGVEIEAWPDEVEMSPHDADAIETSGQARDFAIEWQSWFGQKDHFMSEHAEWGSTFEKLAEKFPELADEFRENAII